MADECAARNVQIICHAIGDGAVDQFLRMAERLPESYRSRHRPRIVHCQLANPEQIGRLAALGVHADIQPLFVPADRKLLETCLSAEDRSGNYAWRSMLRSGMTVSGSSDAPVDSYLPFYGIEAAVTRQYPAQHPAHHSAQHTQEIIPPHGIVGGGDIGTPSLGGLSEEECLTIGEAVALYTAGAACSCGAEHYTGKIKEGYAADFTLADKDPYAAAPEDIGSIRAVGTIVDGEGACTR
jgi:predicted amidohydrolase YtcJ